MQGFLMWLPHVIQSNKICPDQIYKCCSLVLQHKHHRAYDDTLPISHTAVLSSVVKAYYMHYTSENVMVPLACFTFLRRRQIQLYCDNKNSTGMSTMI